MSIRPVRNWLEWFSWSAVAIVAAVGFVVASVAILGVSRFSHDRKEFLHVKNVIRQQLAVLEPARQIERRLSAGQAWSNELPELKVWLMSQLLSGKSPEEVRSRLRILTESHMLSLRLERSVDRWQEGLQRWSEAQLRARDREPTVESLLHEGRMRFFEASGYLKVGRGYDASVLFLWAIRSLTEFVDRSPGDSRLPEALYLLGTGLAQFRSGERVLTLCSEIYPESIWAAQARRHLLASAGPESNGRIERFQ